MNAKGDLTKRLGLTIVELLVAVAMMAILAAVALPLIQPGVQSDLDRARTAALALGNLRDAINSYEVTLTPASFRQNIGKNPTSLSQLTNKIVATNAGYLNSCGNQYSAAEVTSWSSTGPYWNGQVTNGFAQLAPGYAAQDQLVITAVDQTAFNSFTNMGQIARIRMPSVSRTDAENLALVVDGDVDGAGASHTVAFVVSGASAISVDYIVLMTNKPQLGC